MGEGIVSHSFDAFQEQILLSESKTNFPSTEDLDLSDQKLLSKEFQKILDKIALEVLYDRFENSNLIRAILELTRSERIIIVFHIILGMTCDEVSFLLEKAQTVSTHKKVWRSKN